MSDKEAVMFFFAVLSWMSVLTFLAQHAPIWAGVWLASTVITVVAAAESL